MNKRDTIRSTAQVCACLSSVLVSVTAYAGFWRAHEGTDQLPTRFALWMSTTTT